MTPRVHIDPERCTGHGRCYSLVPELFDSDDAGRGTVIAGELADNLVERALVAVRNCPEGAIELQPADS